MEREQSEGIIAAVQAYRRGLQERRQRGMVVLSGTRPWCREQVLRCVTPSADGLWLGEDIPPGIEGGAAAGAQGYLGQERGDVVLDAWAGFDADALGAIGGTVRAGHLLFLLTPPLDDWPDYDDPEHARITVAPYTTAQVGRRFVRHVIHQLRDDPAVLRIGQDGIPLHRPVLPTAQEERADIEPPYHSADQRTAVEALLHVVHGHRRRPLVLSSDRGRGKSSALGLAAAQLLRQGRERVVITGPSLAGTAMVFARIAEALPGAEVARGHVRWQGREVRFLPPDELLRLQPETEMVMVDEAAAIPVALLTRLLWNHSRIAFATTVHGYEGTGRGFELRFKKVLDSECPEWHELKLKTPIRWAEGDPLERSVYRLLLLDAEAADLPVQLAGDSSWSIEHLSRDTLVRDRTQLSQLFGLLVNAHYRTRPYDLRHLLDAPNVELFVMQQAGDVIGVVVAAREGLAGQAISEAIYAGQRRLHGHLLPQSLLAHAGERQALDYAYLRIMRIAIHPLRRRHGLGSALMDFVGNWAREQGLDMLGASFGASHELLAFWLQLGLQPVRIGFRREASSGSHAVMVLQPLGLRAEAFFQGLRERFIHDLPYLLGEPLRELEAELVPPMMRFQSAPEIDLQQSSRVEEFIAGRRDYEASLPVLWQFLATALDRWEPDRYPQLHAPLALLVRKLWQRYSFSELAERYNLPGRRGVLEALRTGSGEVHRLLFEDTTV
jgi:tRNA(Met) cytidine acetyltransferase